jgi:hypothetical protein
VRIREPAKENVIRGAIEYLPGFKLYYTFKVDNLEVQSRHSGWKEMAIQRAFYLLRDHIDDHFQIGYSHPQVRDINDLGWYSQYFFNGGIERDRENVR